MGEIYTDNSFTTHVDWVNWLCTQMVAQGWTRTDIYTAAPARSFASQAIYRVLMQPQDAGQYAGGGYVDIRVGRSTAGGDNQIFISVYPGIKNNKIYDNATDGLTVDAVPGTFTFNLTAHPVVAGDVVAWGGGAEVAVQNPQNDNPQNINANNFQVGFVTAGTFAGLTDVQMWIPQNGAGNLVMDSNSSESINWNEGAAPTTYVWIDGLTVAGFIERPEGFQPFWFGHGGREKSVPAAQSDTWRTTEAIVGGGSQEVDIDRTLVNMQVGATVEVWHGGVLIEEVTITAIGSSPNTVTATFTNAIPAGAIMGKDPLPLGVWGISNSVVTDQDLTNQTVQYCTGQNGERVATQTDQQNADLAATCENQIVIDFIHADPQADGTAGTGLIFFNRRTGNHVRQNRMRGMISVPNNTGVNDYDRPVTGAVGVAGTKYYKASNSIQTGDSCSLAIGPTDTEIA